MYHDFEIMMYHKERQRDRVETASQIRRAAGIRKRLRAERLRTVRVISRGLVRGLIHGWIRGWEAFRAAWCDEWTRVEENRDVLQVHPPAACS